MFKSSSSQRVSFLSKVQSEAITLQNELEIQDVRVTIMQTWIEENKEKTEEGEEVKQGSHSRCFDHIPINKYWDCT